MDLLTKKCRGGVTVFLIIIMLPSFVFGGYVFDAARLDAAKTIVTSSGDLVFNALLSEFHDELYDNYGLLATQNDPSSFKDQAEMYFNNNLESSSMIQGSDAISLNIINSFKNFMNSSNSQEFDNLVKISAINNLSIAGANESQITNPDAMKNQIVEYMKYRGPVSLVSGLITKLKTLGDLDKQAEAVNKKIEYEDKVSQIGKKCQEAYNTINEYNDMISKTPIDNMLKTLQAINNAQMEYICEVLRLHNEKDNKVTKYKKDNLSSTDKKELKKYSQDDLYNYIKKYFDDSDLKNIKSALTHALALKNANADDYPDTMYKAVKSLEKKYDSYNKLYFYCEQYCSNYDKEMSKKYEDENYVETEEDKEYKQKYEKVRDFKKDFADKGTIIYQIQNNKVTDYSAKINDKFKAISESVNTIKGQIVQINYKLYGTNILEKNKEGIKRKLENIEKAIDEAESAKKKYKKAIDDLAQSEYKASMKAEFESSARDLDKNKLKTLQKTIAAYKKYNDDLFKSIENGGTFYKKNLNKSITTMSLPKIEPGTTKAEIKSNFKKYKTSGFSGTKPEVINEEDKFYKYLKSICKDSTGDESKKNKLDHVLSSAKPPENKSLSNADSSISSASGYIEKTDGSEKVNNFESGKYDKNKTAGKFMNYFNSMGSFLKSITNIRYIFDGENSRDTLYISEYMTEMFSHYTSESGENDVTLAGKSTSTNPFYQSEVEYILCGMDTPQANIEAMKSKLFTTRFVFNLLYAMTDTQITSTARTTAASIAGSMPFMIPVIKTIIVCGFALGESTIDVKALMDGKDVAFIKTEDTFVFKPDKFLKEGINFVEEEVTNAVVGGIDDITDTILGISNNGLDDIISSLDENIEKVSSDMAKNIESIISSAIFEKAEQIICNDLELSETDIEQELTNILNKIKEDSFGGKISDQIKDKIFAQISVEDITQKIMTVKKEYIDGKIDLSKALDNINKQLNITIESVGIKIQLLVYKSISGVGNELKNSIQEIADNYIKDSSNGLKSEATEEINKAFDKFNQSISSNTTTDTSKKGNSSAGAGFTMNYKEYLKLFVLLQNFDNSNKNSQRDAMLQRTANLIGINLKSKDKNIDLSKMYTIITINGDVDVETTFLDIPIIENEKGQKDFDFRSINKKSRKLNYESVRGY